MENSIIVSPFHKMATLFLSEVFNYIKLNSNDIQNPAKLSHNESDYSSSDNNNYDSSNEEINFELRIDELDSMNGESNEDEEMDNNDIWRIRQQSN